MITSNDRNMCILRCKAHGLSSSPSDDTKLFNKYINIHNIKNRQLFLISLMTFLDYFGLSSHGIKIHTVSIAGVVMRFHLPKELFQTESDMELSISFLPKSGPEMIIFKENGSSWKDMDPILLGENPSAQTVIDTIVGLSVEAGGYPGVPGMC